jgi:hypothetical protein
MYHSEWLTAGALTQTYTYMIENGLEYSKLVTGETDIFLQLKEDEPHTLYYHLAEPNIEAEAQSEVDILLCRTAVSQILTFCLMALNSKPHCDLNKHFNVDGTRCKEVHLKGLKFPFPTVHMIRLLNRDANMLVCKVYII